MTRPSRPARAAAFLVFLAGLAVTLAPAKGLAQELIQPRVKDRKFPSGLFCPIPIDGSFVADGPAAIIRFSTNVYRDAGGGTLEWTRQFLDNICVAPLAVYNANLGPPGGYSDPCYSGEDIPDRFYFQNAGALPLLETFDTEPTPRGWDLSHGAYWDPTSGAPNSPGPGEPPAPFDPVDPPLGCLGLGQEDATPSLADSAETSVVVSGLTAGQTYVVSGWWDVRRMDLDQVFLTLRVYGNNVTPVLRRTWGGLKRSYR
jgi:hypothetical protein